MKIETKYITNITVEDFADLYDLILVVEECEYCDIKKRYYAFFKDTAALQSNIMYENNEEILTRLPFEKEEDKPKYFKYHGSTPLEAIVNYINLIVGTILIKDYGTPNQKEIRVPRLQCSNLKSQETFK